MSDTKKELDQEKGDEVLKRMLKTPPKPHEKDDDRSRRLPLTEEDRENEG